MTNQQGPPLRLKAVNTETGEASRSFSISWSGLSYINDEKDSMITDFSTPAIHLPGVSMSSIQLCQSTGLHDARGVEIFCGDVLMWDANPLSLYRVIWIDRGVFVYGLDDDPEDLMPLTPENQIEFDVIGNRWQSREVLEQKAKEVMDDACR